MTLHRAAGAAGLLLLAAASAIRPAVAEDGWATLIGGASLGAGDITKWDQLGKADWKVADGAIEADAREGKELAYLVSKASYRDFRIHAEFWASDDANSGIFIRCAEHAKVDSNTCYEVNIFDQRPQPEYGTGAIVDVARVDPMPKAGGRWNSYDITAQGDHLVVVLNGVTTADVHDSKHADGPFALQYASGTIRFRKVRIKPL